MSRQIVLLLLLYNLSTLGQAQVNLQQDHPAQFISYWKSSVINAEQDERVDFVQQVFQRLLRGWENNRLEPALYIVDADQGAWAVSLVDGNILLSRQAIDALMQFGLDRAEHLVAFVLAHELAHQQADDLWQHRFFHQTLTQEDREQWRMRLQMDQRLLQQMEQQEAQADYDGLKLMASVGFDPQQIFSNQDFFTEWVENIWQQPCAAQQDDKLSEACRVARDRAQRTRSQLKSLANQSSLYQLGIQAMVASEYARARQYFLLYGRDFPSRPVMSAIGSTHLAQALELRRQLVALGAMQGHDIYLPIILDTDPGLATSSSEATKRSGNQEIGSLKQQLDQHVTKAVSYFEKAIRLSPNHSSSYRQLIHSYLAGGNIPMAQGILQGKYVPRFGDDHYANLYTSLTMLAYNKPTQALTQLRSLSQQLLEQTNNESSSDNVLTFAVFQNLTALQDRQQANNVESIQAWQKLARSSQVNANVGLFRLALNQINTSPISSTSHLKVAPSINGVRLGNRKARDDSEHTINELWVEGDQYHVYRYENGAHFITGPEGKIISASQTSGQASIGNLKIGDNAERTLLAMGLPDRQQYLASGEYLAYDNYGLAIHIEHNQVKGWFLY